MVILVSVPAQLQVVAEIKAKLFMQWVQVELEVHFLHPYKVRKHSMQWIDPLPNVSW